MMRAVRVIGLMVAATLTIGTQGTMAGYSGYPVHPYGLGPFSYQKKVEAHCRRFELRRDRAYRQHGYLQFDPYCDGVVYDSQIIAPCSRNGCFLK